MQGIVCLHVRMVSIGYRCGKTKSPIQIGKISKKKKKKDIHRFNAGDRLSTC